MSGATRTVLVTGGAGFIGSHVVDALIERGDSVRVLDRLHPAAHAGPPAYLNPAAEYVFGDLRDLETAAGAVAGVDVISHQAAQVGLGTDLGDAPDFVSNNSLGTAVLLAALAEAGFDGPLVLAGSMVVYGEGRYHCPEHGTVRAPPRTADALLAGEFEPRCPGCRCPLESEPVPEDAPIDPRSVYASTKHDQERLCGHFARETGASVTILRYHNVYGPRMPRDTPYAGVASIFRSSLEAGRPPQVFEDGAQRRDFIHVTDVARANILTLERETPGCEAFNIGSGRPTAVGEMARGLADAMGGPAPEITGEFRLGDVRHVFASVQRAQRELDFAANVSLGDGLRQFAKAPLRAPAVADGARQLIASAPGSARGLRSRSAPL